MPNASSDTREFMRHTVATVAYRAAKALRDAPADFGDFRAGPASRTPRRILAHMGDLFDWALSQLKGRWEWRDSEPLPWEEEVSRFFGALSAFDAYLASDAPLGHPATQIFQGAVADALTHIGQLTMLRRLAGSPVRGESYARAEIVAGRTGAEQAPPRAEFD